jgi:hypothetical protein
MSTVHDVRSLVSRLLTANYREITQDEYGSIIIPFVQTMIICRFRDLGEAGIVVTVNAPVLLEVPSRPELYELVAVSSVSFPYGSLSLGAGDTDATLTLGFDAPLFGEDLLPRHLQRAIRIVHNVSLDQTRRLQPVFGGHPVFP